jgi:hypothetical protein
MGRPKRCNAQSAVLIAPAAAGFHGLAFLRGVMMGVAPRAVDAIVALADIDGAVGGDASDLLIGRNLDKQLRQHGCVAQLTGG